MVLEEIEIWPGGPFVGRIGLSFKHLLSVLRRCDCANRVFAMRVVMILPRQECG